LYQLQTTDRYSARLCERSFEATISKPAFESSDGGCSQCTDGYKGRMGLYQVMPVTETIGRIINGRAVR